MKIIIVNVNGTIEDAEIPNDLDAMQAIVGGNIELLRIAPTVDAWINEDGKRLELPVNPLADKIAHKFLRMIPGDHIVGRMFFTGNDGGEDSIDVPRETVYGLIAKAVR